MQVRLSDKTYIRIAEKFAYIANIRSGNRLTFDESGIGWLRLLTPDFKDTEDIINRFAEEYAYVDRDILMEDFTELLTSLAKANLVETSTGENNDEVKTDEVQKISVFVPKIADLTIELTKRCNEKCIHCYLPEGERRNGVMMTDATIESLIDEFVAMGGQTITFTGGEAFMHPSVAEIMEYADSKGLMISLYSNLLGLTPAIAGRLKKLRIQAVQASLYGMSPEVHDSVTLVKGSCRRTIEGIRLLNEKGIPVRIACSVMRNNLHDVCNVIGFAKELKIPVELELFVNPRTDRTKDNTDSRPDIAEMEAFLEKLAEYDHEFCANLLIRHWNRYDETFDFTDYLNSPVCAAGYLGLYVTSTGEISVCPNIQGLSAGNVAGHSLSDVWEKSPVINSFRQSTESAFRKCAGCELSDYCIRCFARNYTESGDILSVPDYSCDMARLAKKIVDKYHLTRS